MENLMVSELSAIFNIGINNPKLFERALTHTSYTQDNKLDAVESYERLEFLGDAVLKLCISAVLLKKYPNYAEGELSKIRSIVVSDNTLAEISNSIGLVKLIILGENQEKEGGRKLTSIAACTFEAILGAYYLDGKMLEIFEYMQEIFAPYITEVDAHFEKYNAKASLQEYSQSKSKSLPEYRLIQTNGPSHNKTFKISVLVDNKIVGEGEGKSKKEAEQHAALEACKTLGVIK